MVLLRVVFTDGTVMNFGTSAGATSPWLVADADAMFSPYRSTGAWAGGDGMPQVRTHVCACANASEFFVLALLVIKPSVYLPTRTLAQLQINTRIYARALQHTPTFLAYAHTNRELLAPPLPDSREAPPLPRTRS
jgi:hypothetical protein